MHQVLSHWCSYQVICAHQVLSHRGCDWIQALFRVKKNKKSSLNKSSESTYLQNITVQYSTLHYSTLHYLTVKYSTLHHTTVHYITVKCSTLHYTTVHYSTVHYSTYMQRIWCTKSYFTREAQVLSHQNLHTYSTLHYITVRYITVHTCIGLGAQNRMSLEGHKS